MDPKLEKLLRFLEQRLPATEAEQSYRAEADKIEVFVLDRSMALEVWQAVDAWALSVEVYVTVRIEQDVPLGIINLTLSLN